MELYAQIPESFEGMTVEELQALLDTLVGQVDAVSSGAADTGELSFAEILEASESAVAGIEAIRGELEERETIAVEQASALAALAERAGITAEEPEAPAEEPAAEPATSEGDDPPAPADEPETPADEPAAEPQAVAAAAQPPVRMTGARPPLGRAPAARPVERRPTGALVATAEGLGVPMGAEISRRDVAAAMINKRRGWQFVPEGVQNEKHTIATIHTDWSSMPERILDGDPETNSLKIEKVVGDQALTASGGLCAPVTPYYDLMMESETMRPVRDALPRFNAERGGIRFMAPPSLAAVTTGVGRITAAADGLGGTNATKTCQTVSCPSQTEVDVAIIFHCLRFGNLGTRAWPEQVDQFTGLTMAAFARVAEIALLDGIGAASTAVTGAQAGGAANTLLGQIITAAAGQRNRHRMSPDRRLRLLLPVWSIELLLVDLLRQQFDRFEATRDGLIAYLRTLNVEPTFYQDGATGAGQIFGAQAGGALLGFPSTVVWYLFPEGSFLYLDSGTLELGIVRDSTLNSTNDYQIFGESFENVAFIGFESLKVTSTVCATGEVTAPRTLSCAVGP